MKRIIFLMALFYSLSFGQGWNSTVTTTINESTLEKMDLFTNKDGNHLLIKRANGNIVYYNLNSLGTVITSKTVTLQTSGDFPAITGSNDVVYAIYKTGNNIRVKYSTNGGSSWLSTISDRPTTANTCNGIDAIYEIGQGVHLVWATMDSDPNFETYYYQLTPLPGHTWTGYKPVTDYSGGVGGSPTVVFSQGRVHVSYNLRFLLPGATGAMKTRDRYNGVWQTAQFISTTDESMAERLEVRGDYLYAVYGKLYPISYFHLVYKSRTLSGTWTTGEGTIIDYALLEDPTSFNLCKTYNDKLQVVYVDITGSHNFYHRSFDGSWSGTFTLDGNQDFAPVSKGLANASNDVFVTWKRNEDNYIRYRQYDDNPLAPKNLAVSVYTLGTNTYPKLTWNLNNEPDVYIKSNAYQIYRRYSISGGPWSQWSFLDSKNGNQSEFIDWSIGGLYAEANTAEYKIRAVDVNNHFSDFSSSVSINFSNFNKINSGLVKYDYELNQNYPNPFNPTTTIDYSIKSAGEVTLKVYDILGTEVASLVNEMQEAGNHSVTFNAADLPSGIYVYRLTTNNFISTKKIILLK